MFLISSVGGSTFFGILPFLMAYAAPPIATAAAPIIPAHFNLSVDFLSPSLISVVGCVEIS